jgi:hypothetical protein
MQYALEDFSANSGCQDTQTDKEHSRTRIGNLVSQHEIAQRTSSMAYSRRLLRRSSWLNPISNRLGDEAISIPVRVPVTRATRVQAFLDRLHLSGQRVHIRNA